MGANKKTIYLVFLIVLGMSLSSAYGEGMQDYNRVFVTSGDYDGNLGGLAGADSKCQAAANAASLGGTWKAWLSNSTISASSRLVHSSIPYKRLDGALVANDWADLTDGSLINPIQIDQNGGSHAGMVWTGTTTSGNKGNHLCVDWTSSAYDDIGNLGFNYVSSDSWTSGGNSRCEGSRFLYCFEQIHEDLTINSMDDITNNCPYDTATATYSCTALDNITINNDLTIPGNVVFQAKNAFSAKDIYAPGDSAGDGNGRSITINAKTINAISLGTYGAYCRDGCGCPSCATNCRSNSGGPITLNGDIIGIDTINANDGAGYYGNGGTIIITGSITKVSSISSAGAGYSVAGCGSGWYDNGVGNGGSIIVKSKKAIIGNVNTDYGGRSASDMRDGASGGALNISADDLTLGSASSNGGDARTRGGNIKIYAQTYNITNSVSAVGPGGFVGIYTPASAVKKSCNAPGNPYGPCGSCPGGQSCVSGVCQNVATCSSLNKNCGSWSDGYGGTLNCGSCPGGQSCVSGVCQRIERNSPCPPYGDVDKDGKVSYDDVILAFDYYAGSVNLDAEQLDYADVNDNGVIDFDDYFMISFYLYGRINTFPACRRLSPCSPLGDVNLDGWVNVDDAILLGRYVVGLESLTSQQIENADVDGYAGVTLADGHVIGEYVSRTRDTFPACFDFSLSLNPSSGSVNQGDSVSTVVKVPMTSGVSDKQIALSFSGLPLSASGTISPSQISTSSSAIFKIDTLSLTSTGSYQIWIAGTGEGKTRTAAYTLTVKDATPPYMYCSSANDFSVTPDSPTDYDKISVMAQASDNSGISKIELLADGNVAKTCYSASSCSVQVGPYSAGSSHKIAAKAYDMVGNIKECNKDTNIISLPADCAAAVAGQQCNVGDVGKVMSCAKGDCAQYEYVCG